jgi:hypothetical protein
MTKYGWNVVNWIIVAMDKILKILGYKFSFNLPSNFNLSLVHV